jgi:phosphoglycerol transferase MdoB-like AlkP superfamily enzyme
MFRRNKHLPNKNYFSQDAVDRIFTLKRTHTSDNQFANKNVVLFLMESVSYEYINDKIMPFINSLKNQSVDFNNVYQNGHESVHGTVAVFASIPPFLDVPFYLSDFASIQFLPLGKIFKAQGYTSHFFLGAEHDHFNFIKLTKMLEIDNYYSNKGLKNKSNYDGTWGVFDHYFLEYFSKQTETIKEPFFSVFYNITTHAPFKIPEKYVNKYQKLKFTDQEKSLHYYDETIKDFFEKHQHENWFKNSIFVFTSDHTLGFNNKTPINEFKKHLHIPFFIFEPSSRKGYSIDNYGQQLDIIPSLLDYMDYSGIYYAFGSSMFDENRKNYFIAIINGIFRYETNNCIIGFDHKTDKVVFIYQKEGKEWRKTEHHHSFIQEINFVKAFVQIYYLSLNKNSMF